MKDFSVSRLPSHLVFMLRALIERKEWSPELIEARLGWESGSYRRIVEGPGQARLKECAELLQFAMEAEPTSRWRDPSQGQGAQEAASSSSLPAAFYALQPYRNHPTPTPVGDVVRQLGDDATESSIFVLGILLRVVASLRAEGCLEAESVRELLRDYLAFLLDEPVSGGDTTEN